MQVLCLFGAAGEGMMAHTVGGVVGFPPLPYSPLGDLQATFLRHFPPISVRLPGVGWCLRACRTELLVLVSAVLCGIRVWYVV